MEQKPTAAPVKKKKNPLKAENHQTLREKKKVRPNRPKRTEKTEESWEGGGKKIPEKTI
jgi:hypothetical protein